MITPVEAIPFSNFMETANKKSVERFEKAEQVSELEHLESGEQPQTNTKTVNALFEGANGHNIEFENEGTETIIKIMDKDTHEVIRQIPPAELLEMRSKMEELKGQFLDTYG